MKAKQLIEALQKLDPEAKVLISIRQYNKKQDVIQLPISDAKNSDGSYFWVTPTYNGATITVNLPEENSIMFRKNKNS